MLTSMRLTDREREIVALLRRDPLLGSEAIAAALGTTRTAVNVHLSNLGKKGVILGRGYVLSEEPAVVVIGGANMDVKARSARACTSSTYDAPRGRPAPTPRCSTPTASSLSRSPTWPPPTSWRPGRSTP